MEAKKIDKRNLDSREWTDADLIDGCLKGGLQETRGSRVSEGHDFAKRCFEEIVRRYQQDIYRLGFRYFKSHDDADEICQRTFVKVFEKLHTFRKQAALRTWIYQIAINFCKNLRRDEKRKMIFYRETQEKSHAEPFAATASLEGSQVSPEGESENNVERQEKKEFLTQAVEKLPPTQKSVIILRVFQECSFKEIAEITGSSLSAVKTNFHYGLKTLKSQMVKVGK